MDSVILDVHGVGYELLIPLSTAEKLPMPHATLTLFTYLAVREDALTLYGFLTREEKRLFSLIVNDVKGFGARLALNVLSAMSISAFCTAIASQDIKLLSKINGVGKKSAAQLLLDHTADTFVTPVFNGSASLRDAAGQMIENVTKSVRRKQTVDDASIDKLYADMISLYRLNLNGGTGAGGATRADLGPLPRTAVTLLAALALIWVLIGLYALKGVIDKKKHRKI